MTGVIEFSVRDDTERKTFDKVNFLRFDFGNHIVRILAPPVQKFVHWLPSSRITFECLGDDCPICQNNRSLYLEYGKDARDKGVIARQYRHYLNVLDRTSVKICPSCQTEVKKGINGTYSPTCPSCNTFMANVEESTSNKVKVANISDTNAKLLVSYQQSELDAEGNPKGLLNFDVMFTVIKTDKKNITPVPLPNNDDVVEVPSDALYDLNEAILKLTPEEINNVLRGISLRDIFASRRGEVQEKDLENKVATDTDAIVRELFGED